MIIHSFMRRKEIKRLAQIMTMNEMGERKQRSALLIPSKFNSLKASLCRRNLSHYFTVVALHLISAATHEA